MQPTRVGIREFRENLSSYLESKTPVAITRHGATIGIYLPTKPKPSQAELEAFRVAKFAPVTLGPRILRTETAAIAAVTWLQARFGDMQNL